MTKLTEARRAAKAATRRLNHALAKQRAEEELERWLAAEPVRRIVPAADGALPIIPLPVCSVFDLGKP
jgi:hypothetical protein